MRFIKGLLHGAFISLFLMFIMLLTSYSVFALDTADVEQALHFEGDCEDATANNNDCAVEIGSPSYIIGKIGNGIELHFEEQLDSDHNGFLGDVSISFWLRFDKIVPENNYIFGSIDATDRRFYLRLEAGTVYIHFDDSTDSVFDPVVDTWYHFVLINDYTTNFKVYVDNVLKTTIVDGGDGSNLDLAIGTLRSAGSFYATQVNTSWDEYLFFDTVLSEPDIEELYNNGDGFAYPFDVAPSFEYPTPNSSTHVNDFIINVSCSSNINLWVDTDEVMNDSNLWGWNETSPLSNSSSGLSDDIYYYKATCSESANTTLRNVTLDNTLPIISWSSPVAPINVFNPFTVSVNYFDTYLDAINITLYNSSNNKILSNFTKIGLTEDNYNYSESIDFSIYGTGTYHFQACGRDSLTNSPKLSDLKLKIKDKNNIIDSKIKDKDKDKILDDEIEIEYYHKNNFLYDIEIESYNKKLKDSIIEIDFDGKHFKESYYIEMTSQTLNNGIDIIINSDDIKYYNRNNRKYFTIADTYYRHYEDVKEPINYYVIKQSNEIIGYKIHIDYVPSVSEIININGTAYWFIDPITGGLNQNCENSSSITYKEYQALRHVDIDIPEIVFDSSSYIVTSNVSFSSFTSSDIYIRGSGMVSKLLNPQSANIFMRIDLNGEILVDTKINTVSNVGDIKVFSIPTLKSNINTNNNIVIYFKEDGLGSVNVSGLSIHMNTNTTESSEEVISFIGNSQTNFASTSFINISEFNINKLYASKTYIDVTHTFISDTDDVVPNCYVTSNNQNSTLYSRSLINIGDVGSSGLTFLFNESSSGWNDYTIFCKTQSPSIISNNITFYGFEPSVNQKDISAESINGGFTISGDDVIYKLRDFKPRINGQVELSVGLTVSTLEATDINFILFSENVSESSCYSNFRRTYTEIQEFGTIKIYLNCDDLTKDESYDFTLIVRPVAPLNSIQMSLQAFEVETLNTTLEDIQVIPNIIIPTDNTAVNSNYSLEMNVLDLSNTGYSTNISLFDSSGVVLIDRFYNETNDENNTIFQINSSAYTSDNYTVKVSITNSQGTKEDTVLLIYDNSNPLITILSPINNTVVETFILNLTIIDQTNTTTYYSLDGITNNSYIGMLQTSLPEGEYNIEIVSIDIFGQNTILDININSTGTPTGTISKLTVGECKTDNLQDVLLLLGLGALVIGMYIICEKIIKIPIITIMFLICMLYYFMIITACQSFIGAIGIVASAMLIFFELSR